MDLYKQFDALRHIISEDDHVICGLARDRRGEAIRRGAMSTMTAMDVNEDENRSDSETVFFFTRESDAKMCMARAFNLGLVPGEFTFDPTVSESLGVGGYAVRFAPHVKNAKKEVLFSLWRAGLGDPGATARMYEHWMGETGGALCVAEGSFDKASEMSGTNHPYGVAHVDSDAVGSLSGKKSSGGDGDVDSLTQAQLGRIAPYHDEVGAVADAALKTFSGAQTPNAGSMYDFVHDGTNGTPIDGGAGAQHAAITSPGGGRANPRMEGSSVLSEELRQIAGMAGGVDELRSLLE